MRPVAHGAGPSQSSRPVEIAEPAARTFCSLRAAVRMRFATDPVPVTARMHGVSGNRSVEAPVIVPPPTPSYTLAPNLEPLSPGQRRAPQAGPPPPPGPPSRAPPGAPVCAQTPPPTLAPTLAPLSPGQRRALEACLAALTGRLSGVLVIAAVSTETHHVIELMTPAGSLLALERIGAGEGVDPIGSPAR